MNTKLILLTILVLSTIASAVDCPPGFGWDRMSGPGCVQADCVDVAKPNSHFSWTGDCICGTDDCKGNPYCIECYEPVNYTKLKFDPTECGVFCPKVRLVACVKPLFLCPNEILKTTTTKATTTTTTTSTTTTTVPSITQQPQQSQKPNNESCADFGVQPKDFDLTYDDKMLNKEFLDFLDKYMESNKLQSASDKYSGWDPAQTVALGYFLFTEDMNYSKKSKYWTGNEDTLGQRITARFKQQNRPLTPSEVLEESLKANNNYMLDALLCAHNYMKNHAYDVREIRKIAQNLTDADTATLKTLNDKLMAELKATGHLTPEGEVMDSSHMSDKYNRIMAEIAKVQGRIDANKKRKDDAAKPVFGQLQQLRKSDNEGTWYHIFGTLTAGYSERENTWAWFGDNTYTRIELWGEHRIYKGLIGRRADNTFIDWPKYCWDVWGGYLGGELYSKIGANRPLIKQQVMKDPSTWMDLSEMGYVKDGHSGAHIYK